MPKKVSKTAAKNGTNRETGRGAVAVLPAAPEVPGVVELRARVTGEVRLRLRVHDHHYTAEKIARLLNAGNRSWDLGSVARYHRIEKGGRVIAEIEDADEDINWEEYEAD